MKEWRCRFCGWNWRQDHAPTTCECVQSQRRNLACSDYRALIDNGYRVQWGMHVVKESFGYKHLHFECRVQHFLFGGGPSDVSGVYEKVPCNDKLKPLAYCARPIERMFRRARMHFLEVPK